ncbi:MAG: 50S ribosome-binding GTPase [Oligoflexia bacterium]|nr:50S ribosome-binding GTPase [Oligoflexia bacterium]
MNLSTKLEFVAGLAQIAQVDNWLTTNPDPVGLMMVGRSNVGKSSLINSIFNTSIARISKTPGKTREINVYRFYLDHKKNIAKHLREEPCFLFDLPGYGHAQVSKEMRRDWDMLINHFFTSVYNKRIALLNIKDARVPDIKTDSFFSDYIINTNNNHHHGHHGHHGHQQQVIYPMLVFNKIDKLKTQSERAQLKKSLTGILQNNFWAKQVYFVSAEKGDGMNELKLALLSFLLGKITGPENIEISSHESSIDESREMIKREN